MQKKDLLISEYKRLLKEGENACTLDEENIQQQLSEIREEYQKITRGCNIDNDIK